MSDSTAIALIVATFFFGLASFTWLSKTADAVALKVATGLVEGVPISVRLRRLLLYHLWTNYALMCVVSAAFPAVVLFQIAPHVATPGVKGLAYLGGFIAITGAVGGALSFAMELIEHRALLREAERD